MANKYPGYCSDCGCSVPAGHGDLTKQGSKWVVLCGGKGRIAQAKDAVQSAAASGVLLNSPGRTALHGRGRGDFSVGEESEIRISFVAKYRPDAQFAETIYDQKTDRYLTCVGFTAHHVSQDEADDFDLIGTNGGFSAHWSVERYYRLATDEEAAPVKAARLAEQQKREEAARKEQEIMQDRKDFATKMAELTDGLVRVATDYTVLNGDGQGPYLLNWSHRSDYMQLKETTSKITGTKAYVHPHGMYDDYRNDMFVDQQTAEASFERRRVDMAKYGDETPAKAKEWLEKYSGCVGAAYYEWLAKQAS